MSSNSDRRILARWIFYGSGWALALAAPYLLRFLTNADQQAAVLFMDSEEMRYRYHGILSLLTSVSGLICLLTSRGFRLGRTWARWTGMAACLMLLPLFPLLTIAGIFGAWFLLNKWNLLAPQPADAKPAPPTTDYWTARRRSPAQKVLAGVVGVVALSSTGLVEVYARMLGMRSWNPGILCLPLLLLVDVTVHEMGHLTVAWALNNRLRTVNIGPFTFRNLGHGYQFHFDWRRMFAWGGFVSSASLTGDNLRMKLIAEVAGGPAAAALGALTSSAIFLLLPGTALQVVWWIPGYLFVLFVNDAIVNLLPVGYSDGSMLFHLILWTDAGKLLISRSVVAQIREDASALHGQADFGKKVELWRGALQHALPGGARNALLIAHCHAQLGGALYSTENFPAAEAELRQCLSFEAECAIDQAMYTTCWMLLQRIAFERHQAAEVPAAYAKAIAAMEANMKGQDRVGASIATLCSAGSHYYAGAFDKTIDAAEATLRMLPPGRERLVLRAEALSLRGRAEFALGEVETGRASVVESAETLRSPEVPAERRNDAWDDMADLGLGLWRVGEPEMCIEYLREATASLEAGGAMVTAAQQRCKLSAILRQTGRMAEARQCLPEEAGLPDDLLRALLAERARLHLAAGDPTAAIADAERALELWRGEPVESAAAESLLAEACLDAGDHLRAGDLAHKAAEVLGPWQHCEMASCLTTIALAEGLPEHAEKARQLIEADSLLLPDAKKRLLDAQTARMKRFARPDVQLIANAE